MSEHYTQNTLTHHLRPLRGRDSNESHRAASSLELLFDLTFAIAFGQAGNAAAHLLAEGHFREALIGFSFATFAICWAWINFSWFASAFDTDDWLYRLTTMVQMCGVLFLAIGLPRMFNSLIEGEYFDNRTMVFGYIVMRLAMVVQWTRAMRANPALRKTCLLYIKTIVVAQIGWTILAIFDVTVTVMMLISIVLVFIEFAGPYLAEQQGGTPWHAHHIAERHSLLAIIALGECLIGTISALAAEISVSGWTWESGLVAFSGTALTFVMWWLYTVVPSAELLHHDRRKSFVWGYGHIFLFGSIAAVGAGLHVIAYVIEHQAHISEFEAILITTIPTAIYMLTLSALYIFLVGHNDRRQIFIGAASLTSYILAPALALLHVPLAFCVLVLVLGPAVALVLDETNNANHRIAHLEALRRK